MTIYIDSDYKCYVSAAEGRRAIEVNDFNGKCPEWIESYRFVPEGARTERCSRTWQHRGKTWAKHTRRKRRM